MNSNDKFLVNAAKPFKSVYEKDDDCPNCGRSKTQGDNRCKGHPVYSATKKHAVELSCDGKCFVAFLPVGQKHKQFCRFFDAPVEYKKPSPADLKTIEIQMKFEEVRQLLHGDKK
jgi:hypothetical protein